MFLVFLVVRTILVLALVLLASLLASRALLASRGYRVPRALACRVKYFKVHYACIAVRMFASSMWRCVYRLPVGMQDCHFVLMFIGSRCVNTDSTHCALVIT
jgi:hypothetical protein